MSQIVSANVAAFDDTGYTPLRKSGDRGPNQPVRSRLVSRRQKTVADDNNVPVFPGGPGGWVDPPAWQDGARYGADELNQQLIVNMEHVMRPLLVVEELWEESVSAITYAPTLNLSLGANEVWYLKYCLLFSATDDWFTVWRGPTGITFAGANTYLDNNGVTYNNDVIVGAGPTYNSWQGSGLPFGSNTVVPLFTDVLVTTVSAGTLEFGFDCNATGTMSIYPGSIIMGVKASDA